MQADLSHQTVLVTGAAGFIGSHVCDSLLAGGATVYGVDNFLTGRPQNLSHLENEARFMLIQADVIQPPITYVPAGVTFTHILHLASPASPPRYQAHPIETYQVNSLGTHHLLQFLLKNNPQGIFLFASTSEVYGDPLEHPQSETYWGNVNPNGPRSCYDEAKRLGESICGVHQRDFKLDVRIVRIFNTYGPRMDIEDGRIIPNLAKQVLSDTSVSIYGDGSQTRSFCYVSDLVAGLLKFASLPNLSGSTINLGNPQELTVLEAAHIIFEVAGELQLTQKTTLEIEYQPLPTDDPLRRRPDITRANEQLAWKPSISLRDGLKSTLKFFSQK